MGNSDRGFRADMGAICMMVPMGLSHISLLNWVLFLPGVDDADRARGHVGSNPNRRLENNALHGAASLAGLQVIDKGLYESSSIDGAGKIQTFFKITLPLLKPSILVAVLFRTLDAFRVYDLIAVMTEADLVVPPRHSPFMHTRPCFHRRILATVLLLLCLCSSVC